MEKKKEEKKGFSFILSQPKGHHHQEDGVLSFPFKRGGRIFVNYANEKGMNEKALEWSVKV